MLLSILKAIFHQFYPLGAIEAEGRQRIAELPRPQRCIRSIHQATRTTTANTAPTNTKNALLKIKPSAQKPAFTRIRKHRCPACSLYLSRNNKSLQYRRKKLPGLCFACTMILKPVKGENLIQRFKQPKKRQNCERHHEANFIQYLHKMQGSNNLILSKANLYHLPLSTNYYRKLNKRDFVYHSSYPEDNTVSHFHACAGCRSFVSTRRKTLVHTTQQARRKRGNIYNNTSNEVVSTQDLFKIMISSDSSCAFSGRRGVWHSSATYGRDYLYSLSLDHKVPLSKGGSSTIDNLQVSLKCLNNIKGSHSNKEFLKWWKAFRQKQGCY